MHSDHLGSTSLTTDANGNVVSQGRYLPYGEIRWGSSGPTDFGFTGQRNDSFGLMDFNARFYSPFLGRFVSPDVVVPGADNPQAWNRYAYVGNNPLKYNDPSGHCWGFASNLRYGLYSTTCSNIDMATIIVTSPDATVGQKFQAGAYLGAEAIAHGALAVGVALGSCSLVAPCAAAAETTLGIGTTACADGDCTNEVVATSKALDTVTKSLCADSDCTNEIRTGVETTNRISGPLSEAAKDVLRSGARDVWYQETGRRAIWDGLQIHHRIPLEWAHLFPNVDPNRVANLVGMKPEYHQLVSNAWTAFRTALNGATPTAAQVMEQAIRIDEQYGQYMTFVK